MPYAVGRRDYRESAMTIAQEIERGARTNWLTPLAVACVAAMALAWHVVIPLNHDVAWIWEGAGRLLDGARFGSDVADVNPPLAWWITAIPVEISRMTGLRPRLSFVAFVEIVDLAVIATMMRLVGAQLTNVALTLVCTILTAALLVAPGYDFGQREHLMAALALPYVGAAGLRAEGVAVPRGLAWTAGFLAGVGFCLKPYFFLIPLLIEIWLFARERFAAVRIETITIAVTVVAYLAAIKLFAPDYLARALPDALAGYGAYHASAFAVAVRLIVEIAPVLAGIGLVLYINRSKRMPYIVQALLVATLGAALAYLIQRKGWSYQALPVIIFACGAAAFAFASGKKTAISVLGLAIVILAASRAAIDQIRDVNGARANVAALVPVFKSSANGKIFAFITSPRDVHPAVVSSGTRWIAPECCLYLIPGGVAARRDPSQLRSGAAIAAADREARTTVARLNRERPSIIAVDGGSWKLGFGDQPFDYIAYFSRKPGFAEFWRNYSEEKRIGDFRIFRCTGQCSGSSR